MKTILYVGNFSFPLGNAAGKRVYANGKILRKLGYRVIYVGMDKNIDRQIDLSETRKEYDGFDFYNFSYPEKSIEWINYISVFKSFINLLENKFEINKIELIIYYGSPSLSLFINRLIKYCKKNNIKIVSDCVDWLTIKTNNPIFDFIKWLDDTYQKAYLNKKVDGVIAISRYLEEYYKKTKIKTVIIPPLSTTNSGEIKTNNKDYKVIIYAGLPFRKGMLIKDPNTLKDRVDKTIMLLYKAKEKGARFKFDIYGFTKSEYLEVLPLQKKYIDGLEDSIEFHGMKPNEEVTEEISKADFTILIRDVNRTTSAGFPTKISESISYGTPVITTKTSDLEDYIVEGVNGFFIKVDNVDDISVNELLNILEYSNNEINKMKSNCHVMQSFNYLKYVDKMESFLTEVLY